MLQLTQKLNFEKDFVDNPKDGWSILGGGSVWHGPKKI